MTDWLARRLWAAMLWVMRRPRIRRLQRWSFSLIPERKRDQAYARYVRQERWARRHGLRLLRLALNVLLISIVATFAWAWLTEALSWAQTEADRERMLGR